MGVQSSQGLSRLTPVGTKSATLRVTTVIPWTSAVAAIRASRTGRVQTRTGAGNGGIDGQSPIGESGQDAILQPGAQDRAQGGVPALCQQHADFQFLRTDDGQKQLAARLNM